MLLPLHLPRRHRRQLLFPPGLLALAWLLWLGCVALPQLRGMERPLQSVLQISLPSLHFDGGWGIGPPLYASEQQLATFRNWRTVTFTENRFADYFNFSQAAAAVELVKADSTYKAGMRIRFSDNASYASLVYSLDLLNKHDIKTWWLDVQHQPTTLYAFTRRPDPPGTMWVCGNTYTHIPESSPPRSLAEFFLPDWRNSTLLLLLMALLSAVRLGRRWRAG